MRQPLTLAVAQPRCVPYDAVVNVVTHAATVRAAGTRVVVAAEDARLAPIIEACSETGSVALVGAPVQGEAGRSHIAMVAVDGSGAADTAALGIDVYVASVLESVEEAVRQEERARPVATDHRVWVAVASFAGSTGGGYVQAAGRSAIWGPGGVLVAVGDAG